MGRGLSPLRLLLGRSPSKRQQQEHLHQQQQQQQHQGGQGAQAQAGGGGDGCEPSGTGKGNATGDRKPLAPAENNAREGDTPAADGAAPVVDRIDIGRAAGSKHHHGKTKPSFARHNVGAGGDAKGGGGVNLCVGAVDAGRGLAGGSARERSSSSTPPRGATGPGWHPAMRGNSNTNPNPNANGGVPLATGGIATGQGQAARLPQPQQSARGGQSEFEGANPSPGGLPGSSGSRMLSNLAAAAVQDGNRSSPRTPVKLRPPPGFDQSSTAIADPPQPTGGVSEHQQHQQNHAGISNRRAGANQGTPGVAEVGDNARSKTPRRSDMAGAPSSAAAAAAAAAPLGAAYRGGIGAGEANGMTPSNQQQPGSAVGTGGYGGATLPNTVKLTKQRGQQARDLALGDGGGPPAGQNGQAGLSLKTAKQIYRTPKYQNGDGGPNAAPVMGFTGGGARTAQRAAMAAGSHIPMFPHLPVEEFDLEETWNSWTEDQSVQVIVRLRPINARESSMHGDRRCLRQDSPRSLIFFTHPEPQRFTFDHVAGEHVTQERLFRVAGFPMVENCLEGYNSCMFAYGQTGSGKTYTMLGDTDICSKQKSEFRGMTPRVFEHLFARVHEEEESRRHEQLRFNCKCSYLEIYNESITDLLDPTLTNLQIREDTKRGMYVESLSEKPVEGVDDVLKIIVEGSSNRKVGQTSMNRESSRSHSVFTCVIESRGCNDGMINVRFSRLNLVDLAGSERQKSSGAEGERLKEAANINKSLSQLGHVIMTLVDVAMGKQRHVPYRGSRLTFLLQDSLGGNAKTVMVANLSPSLSCFSESLSTLKFAQRAKYIQNKAVVNEHTTGDVAVLKDQIRKLKEELFRIRGTAQGLSPLRNSLQASGTMLLADALRSPVGSFDLTRSLVGKESPGQMTKMRSLEIVLAGTIRREQAAQTLLRKKDAEIEELSRMVKLREGDADCCRMVLKIRDDKIRRLEAVADGLIKNADAYLQEENESFQEELALLRRKLDNHPEVAKFAVENMQLLEQLSRYREICDLGECERLRAEIGDLVEQVASLLESNRRSSLIYGKFGVDSQLDPSRSFISGTQKGDASKFEVEALQELSECQRSLESALEANARMARQVDEMQEEILSLRETRAMMEARITALKAKSRESIGITLREAHTPSAEVEKLLAQLAEADESVKEEVEERSRAEEDLRNTVNELRQLRKELKDTKTHIVNTDNLLERLSESEQMLASSKAETAKAIEQLEQLEMEKTAMDQSYKIEIAQLMESMDCREQEFARREAELSKEAQELHVRVGLLEDDHVTMREFEEMHSVKASNMDIPGGEETSKRDHIAEELTLLVPQLEKEKAELEARRDELEMEIANLVELQRKERELRVMTEKERDDRVVEVEELKSAMSEKGSVIVALMTKLEGNAKAMVARQEEVDGLQVRIEEMEEERKIVDEELKVLKEEMAKERSLQELNSPKDMEIAVREARMKLEEERKARHAAEIGRDELALELSSLQKDMEEAQNTIKMLMTEQSLFMAEQFSPRILGDRMGRRVSCGMPMHSQRNELREAKAEAREAEERESFLRNELRRTLQLLEVKEKEIGQIQGCDKDSERDLCGFVSETHGRMSSLEGQKQIAGGKGRLQADVSAFMQEKAKDEVKIAVKETQTDPLLSQEKIAENLEVLQMELERARESAAMAEARAEDACKSKLSAELEVEWLTDQMRNAEQKLADEERSKKNLRSVIFHLRALCNDGDDPVSAEDQDDDAVWLVEMVREKMDRLKNEVAIMSQKKQDWEIYEERKKNELEALMARICALQTDLVDVELRASLAEDLARREQARASKLEEEVAKADVWKVSLDAHVEEIDHMRLSVKEDGEEKKSGWKGLAHSLSKIGKKDKSFEKLKVMIVSAKQEARRVEEIKEKEVKAAIQRAETAEREMAIAHASKKKKEIELQVLLSQVEDLRSELRKKVSEICVLRNASNDSSSLGPSCLKSEESSISEKLHSLEEELETERRKTGVLEMELDEMRATALDAELVRREAEAMVGREKALKGELVAKTKRIEELELEMVDLRAVVGEIEEISLDQEKMVEREKALEEKLESKCRRVEELEHILAAKEEGRRNDQNQLGNWGKLLMELTDTQEERNRAMADREALRRELEVVTAQAKEREFIAMEAQEMAKQCKQAADKKEAELKAALQLQEELQARATALDLQVNKLKACQTLQRGGQEQCLSRRQTLSRGTQDQERTMPSQDIDKSLARVLFSTSPVSANTSARPVNCDEDPRTLFVQLQETTSLATKLQKENYDLRKRLVESEGMTHDVVRDLLGIGRESSANSLVGMTKKLSPPPVSSRTLSTPSTAVRQTPSTAQFQPVPSSLIKAGQEKVRRLSMEARIKDEELAQVRARLDEFILERERWLEELSHQRTEACAAHVSSDKLRQTNHLLTAQNEKLKIQEANLQKRIASLEAEVRKLSGQQNLHQRIHHHVKIKEENQILKTRVEDLELKSRKESMYLQRALEELAKHRTAQGKPPGLNIDEEQRLRSKVEELEDEKHQIAKNLTNVCLAIFRASKASVTGVPSPHGAIEALQVMVSRMEATERELADQKFKEKMSIEKRRLGELRSISTPQRSMPLQFTSPISCAGTPSK